MADWHIYSRRSPSSRDGDFEEEEIWSVMKESEDSSPKKWKSNTEYYNDSTTNNSSISAWRVHSSPRKISRASPTTTREAKVVQRSSAPVNIPDWSKIYGKNAGNGSLGISDNHGGNNGYHIDYNNDDEDADDDDMVPPHEWIAKKLARSQISSSSVCEGIGRTLKGRDLSKVRNAILTKTGFLE